MAKRKKTLNKQKRRSLLLALGTALGLILLGLLGSFISVDPFDSLSSTSNQNTQFEEHALSFFYPGWQESDFWEIFENDPTDKLTSHVTISQVTKDPKSKLEPEFKPSKDLYPRVRFWVNVYARYDSRMKIIHDRDNPHFVYGYLDFRPLFRSIHNPVRRAMEMTRIERIVVLKIKDAMKEVFGLNKELKLENEERIAMLSYFNRIGLIKSKQALSAIENIRTQTGQRDHFILAMKRAEKWLPHIEATLKQQKLPLALARIPFVESSFNINAQSKIGAVGMWQFVPATAQHLISANPDHWDDPIAQTQGAAKLLTNYRKAVPDWGMAVTSYNSGIGRVLNLKKKHGLRTVEDLIRLDANKGLGFAGKNFYTEFLAANIVEAYKEELFPGWHLPQKDTLTRINLEFPVEICPKNKQRNSL